MSADDRFRTGMTKEEYAAFVDEHGYPPGAEPKPGEHHRDLRNQSLHHGYHTRGIG